MGAKENADGRNSIGDDDIMLVASIGVVFNREY
jgi:hypothetical protein